MLDDRLEHLAGDHQPLDEHERRPDPPSVK
jgi:hypothetical protein